MGRVGAEESGGGGVKTMPNSGQLSGYSSRIAALQLDSGPLRITLVPDAHIPFCYVRPFALVSIQSLPHFCAYPVVL